MEDIEEYDAKEYYEKQVNDIQNSILLNDKPVPVFDYKNENLNFMSPVNTLRWLDKSQHEWSGEVIAGSYMCYYINRSIIHNDVDIYFHSKEHATLWCAINRFNPPTDFIHDLCAHVYRNSVTYNLIVGVPFKNTEDLISHFDIRACAIAYDPVKCKVTSIQGAIQDCINKRIVFQTEARSITVKRLVKYIEKGFKIDKYQRAMFVELLKMRSNRDEEFLEGYK
jgi:hypothetical protein